MARKPRIEFPGATYHVMCRGNQRAPVFLEDQDRCRFLDTVDEIVKRTGWRTYAYVLMPNHYHWLFQTPEANLVTGMKWFQGTYTQRFNHRHGRSGHLFQGRYKALLVDQDPDYLGTVANYIHLNPARARLFDLKEGRLVDYRWSSYPALIRPARRPSWLHAEGVLNVLGVEDDAKGRGWYRRLMQRRMLEIASSQTPWEADARWEEIRSGWCFGGEVFREYLLERLGEIIGKNGKRVSYDGEAVRMHDEWEAQRLLAAGLKALGMEAKGLQHLRKSAPAKQVLAWLIRKRTCVSNGWITEQLDMGRATNLSRQIREVEEERSPEIQELRRTVEEKIKISD